MWALNSGSWFICLFLVQKQFEFWPGQTKVSHVIRVIFFCFLFVAGAVSALAVQCRSCGQEIQGDYLEYIDEAVGGSVAICQSCSTNAHKCFHCNVPFKNGLKTLADGRLVCSRDAAEGLDRDEELVVVAREVREHLNELFRGTMIFPEVTALLTRDTRGLVAMHKKSVGGGPPVGLTRSVSRVPGRFDHTVFILSGLRKSRVMAICAHEFTHAWLAEQVGTTRGLADATTEGFCELVALKYMKTVGIPFEVDYIQLNRYTQGQLPAFLALDQKKGFSGVMNWLLRSKETSLKTEVPVPITSLASPIPAASAAGLEPAPIPVPDKLILKGIVGVGAGKMALINNQTLSVGESGKVKIGRTTVMVRCLEIGTNSVLIAVGDVGGRQRLDLGSGR